MFWKELFIWLLAIAKWEFAVRQWNIDGRSELYALVGGLIGAHIGLCVEFAIVFGLFKILRLNGNGEQSMITASIVAQFEKRRPGITMRSVGIFILAIIPIFPLLTTAAIVLARSKKSRLGYLLVYLGVTLKVLGVVYIVYHF